MSDKRVMTGGCDGDSGGPMFRDDGSKQKSFRINFLISKFKFFDEIDLKSHNSFFK